MTRDNISVQYPKIEKTQSIATTQITKNPVVQANGICVEKAFANKNNSLTICVENTSASASEITFKAGDNFPNAKLGDLKIDVDASSINVFQFQDLSRFENKNGSINVDFKSGFTGNIFAVAKSVEIE